ncbi:hypothetical protein Acr_00g0000010 [Actinidia rufa]|uniref:Uncharacterized protein n=1 Tax=Actinidia rufa TaxID=165716 RepID=A0A7J0HG23_9ERIC|nr:hypothetical protein Acr_00g0000010 [Actinidia rufa]
MNGGVDQGRRLDSMLSLLSLLFPGWSRIPQLLGSAQEESFLDSVRRQFANRRWVRTTRGPSRRLVKIEDLERLGESDPEIMANNASHRGSHQKDPGCTCCSRNKPSIYHPGSGDTDPQPQSQSQPRVADARPLYSVSPPVLNLPAVPEPVDHYEEEIRRKPPAVPAVSLAPAPMNQIVPYVPPQPSDPLMEKISRLERAVNKLSGDKRKLGFVKQGPTESFTDFITRWRAQAAQVQKRPSEEDQIAMGQAAQPFPNQNQPQFSQKTQAARAPQQDNRQTQQAQQQQQGQVSYQQGQRGTGSETSQKTGPTTRRVHSVTASDEQVDGRSGTEGDVDPLRAETDAQSIALRIDIWYTGIAERMDFSKVIRPPIVMDPLTQPWYISRLASLTKIKLELLALGYPDTIACASLLLAVRASALLVTVLTELYWASVTKALVHKRGTRRVNEMAFRFGPTGETDLDSQGTTQLRLFCLAKQSSIAGEPVLSGESLTRITGLSKGDRPILSSPRGEEDKNAKPACQVTPSELLGIRVLS